MAVYTERPVPVPTPYQSVEYGGNPYLTGDVLGESIPTDSQPIYGPYLPDQPVSFTSGALVPQQNVSAPTTQITTTEQQSAPSQEQSSGGGVPPVDMSFYQGWTDPGAIQGDWMATWQSKLNSSGGGEPDYTQQWRDELGGAYDNYINSLNNMLGGLPDMRQTQEDTIQSQYQQGLSDVGLQQTQGLAELGQTREKTQTNQAKTLKDLNENIRNMFMAGNVYLGSRGAGDSSAANQYAYALTKMGNKNRGNVTSQTAEIMSQIDARETNLKNIIDNEKRRLASERDQAINGTTQWLQTQQQALKEAIATGQLQKGQDLARISESLVSQAAARLQQQETNIMNQANALKEWALSNSENLAQLRTNLQGVSQFNPAMPTGGNMSGAITSDARGNISMLPGYGSNTEEKRGLFNNG